MKFQSKVMIVEDNRCISLFLEVLLRSWDYHIQGVFATAEEAWAEIQYHPPDLILINMHLAGQMNGLEMIGRIHSRFHFSIILLSGVKLEELPTFSNVLTMSKPFLAFQLKQIMKEVLTPINDK